MRTGTIGAALCILGVSVFPDHEGAIAQVRRALKTGGRFVVLDGRLDRGPVRLLAPLLKPLFSYMSNAGWEKDVVGSLKGAFDQVSVDEFNGGSLFIATAVKTAPVAEENGV